MPDEDPSLIEMTLKAIEVFNKIRRILKFIYRYAFIDMNMCGNIPNCVLDLTKVETRFLSHGRRWAD